MCHHSCGETFLAHCCPPGEYETRAGVHALIIGMSHYPRRPKSHWWMPHDELPLGDIDGAALGAAQFAKFLSDELKYPTAAPIRTVRLLLIPTDDEKDHLPVLPHEWEEANFDNVRDAISEWYRDCNSHPNNVAILYISGHGIVTARSVPLVFLGRANQEKSNPCAQSIDLGNIIEAMAYNQASDNIYFFDCCAVTAIEAALPYDCVHQSAITLPIPSTAQTYRNSYAVIRSARTGMNAYAISASAGTLFSQALLPLLSTAGSLLRGLFTITTDRLKDRLREEFRAIPNSLGQEPDVDGHIPTGIHLPPPPNFRVRFYNDTEKCDGPTSITVYDNRGCQVIDITITSTEKVEELPAGIYSIKAGDDVNTGPVIFLLEQDTSVPLRKVN
ncbi:caspase family protein [Streptomyces sp. NPDC055287]